MSYNINDIISKEKNVKNNLENFTSTILNDWIGDASLNALNEMNDKVIEKCNILLNYLNNLNTIYYYSDKMNSCLNKINRVKRLHDYDTKENDLNSLTANYNKYKNEIYSLLGK